MSIYVTLHLASIEQAWKLLIVTGAGTGTVLLLRWFWWRDQRVVRSLGDGASLRPCRCFCSSGSNGTAIVRATSRTSCSSPSAMTTIVWLAATWLTPPERAETLAAFYRRVRPHGPGWAPVATATKLPARPDRVRSFASW